MDYKRHFLIKKQELEKEISELEKKISRLPDGILRCYEYGDRIFPYQIYPGRHIRKNYLKKNRYDYAGRLALKTFYTARADDCKNELSAVMTCLKAFDLCIPSTDKLVENSLFRDLLKKTVEGAGLSPNEEEFTAWENEDYPKYTGYPENLKFVTVRGIKVRSKAEQEIAYLLEANNIHYRYECELAINGKSYYPDFTIKHPKKGRIIIWEHFGMIDNPEYYAAMIHKLNIYRQAGFILGINLIITYETKDNPMYTRTIQEQIDRWLLD